MLNDNSQSMPVVPHMLKISFDDVIFTCHVGSFWQFGVGGVPSGVSLESSCILAVGLEGAVYKGWISIAKHSCKFDRPPAVASIFCY